MVQVERRKKQRSWDHQLLLLCNNRRCGNGRVSSISSILLLVIVGLWIINQILQNANDNGIFSSSSSSKNRHITPKQLGLPPVPSLHIGSHHGNTTTASTSPSTTTYWCYLDKELTGGMFRSSLHMPYMVQWISGCWSWLEDKKQQSQQSSKDTSTTSSSSSTIIDGDHRNVGIALDDIMYSRFVSSPNFPNWNRPFFQALNLPIMIVDKKKSKKRLKGTVDSSSNKNDEYRDMIYDQLISMNNHLYLVDDGFEEERLITANNHDSTTDIEQHEEGHQHQQDNKAELVQVYTSKKFGGIEWFNNHHSCSTMRQRLWDALKLTTSSTTSSNSNLTNTDNNDDHSIRIGFVERPARRLIVNSSGLAKALQHDYDNNPNNQHKVHVSYEVISDDGEYNTMYEQALWYYTQDIVIMAHGAGTTNVIFMKPGTQLLEMFPHNFFFELYKPLVEECNVNHYYYYDYDNTTKGHYDHHTTGNPNQDFQDHFKERGRNRNVNIYITYEQLKSQVDTMIQKLLLNRQRQEQQRDQQEQQPQQGSNGGGGGGQ